MAFDITTAKPIQPININIPTKQIFDEQEEVKSEQPTQKKSIKDFYSQDLKPIIKKVGDKALGVSRGLTQGATFGQAPHLSGITNELANLPEKYKRIASLDDIKKLYKDTGKDYVKGREQFKKEYNEWADENKGLSLGSELLGGVLTGVGSGALKGLSLAKKPILNAIGSGAGLGAVYGGSNTEGKAIDLKNAGIGAGLGAGLGVAGLGGVKAGQKVVGKLGNLGKLYGKGVDNTAKAINPVKQLVDEEGKALQGTVSNYARPAGTQNRTARIFADNKYVQNEALKGDVGLRFEEYGNDAVKSMSKIKEVAKQAEKNAYKEAGITDDYLIDLSKSNVVKDLENIAKNYNDEIALFANSTKANTNLGNDLLTDLKIATAVNGNKISFGNLKRITKKLYNDKQKAYKDFGGGSSEYKLLNDYYKTFADLKYKDSKLANANAKYAELEKAIENLEETTGINLEKPKQFAAKIFSGARDRADGGIQEQALEDFSKVVEKFADTKELKAISDKIKMAQFAYDLRPTSVDSKFAKDVARGVTGSKTMTGFLSEVGKKLAFGRDINPQEFYQILARRIKSGKIKPEDLTKQFNRIKVAGLDDITANRLFLQNKLLGNRAGMIGKIIEQFYK